MQAIVYIYSIINFIILGGYIMNFKSISKSKKSLAILSFALALASCGSKDDNKTPEKTPAPTETVQTTTAPEINPEQTINFVGDFDMTIELTTKDNWETAELMDNSGQVYKLKRSPSADGVLLKNDDGVSIHMKNREATLILNKGNEIQIKEFNPEDLIDKNQSLDFIGDNDLTVNLSTIDNWETAELMDNSGQVYFLKNSPAASGMLLKNEKEGVSIHLKNGEGILILKGGKEIKVKEFNGENN